MRYCLNIIFQKSNTCTNNYLDAVLSNQDPFAPSRLAEARKIECGKYPIYKEMIFAEEFAIYLLEGLKNVQTEKFFLASSLLPFICMNSAVRTSNNSVQYYGLSAEEKKPYLNRYDQLSFELRTGDADDFDWDAIERSGVETKNINVTPQQTQGCYIATSVYGSYDCPEVWVLRRFRDNMLRKTLAGQYFIKCYYKVSPFLVRHFGHHKWFSSICYPLLNLLVQRLQDKHGLSSSPYAD